jgi:sporulation-control protein spo0M
MGIGNLSVDVKVPSRICIGETLQGTASITGGKVEQIAQGLWVGLRLAWETTDDDGHSQTHHTVLLKRPCELATAVLPGQSHQIQFSFIVPPSLELAQKDCWHQVFAEVDIASSVDVTGTAFIQVFPAQPLGDLLQAVTDNLGWSLGGIDTKRAPKGYLRAIFLPPEPLTKRFDKLLVDVAHSGSSWHIAATVDLREGLWRALTKQDEHRAEFQADSVKAAIRQIGGFVTQWTRES